MNHSMLARVVALLLLAVPAVAQRFPLKDESGREAALIDVASLLPQPAEGAALDPQAMLAANRDLAAFVREFCEPQLDVLHDVQSIGERWLLVLGLPQQVAFVEQLVAVEKQHPKATVLVECCIYNLPAAVFAAHVEPLLPKVADAKVPLLADIPTIGFLFQQGDRANSTARVAVVGGDEATALHAALREAEGVDLMIAPQVLVAPLQAVTMSAGEELAYRRDWESKVVDGETVWSEVRGTVFDGVRLGATCGLLDNDRIALRFELLVQEVVRPMPEFATTLGVDRKVTIELPHTVATSTKQSLVLKGGASAIVVGDKGNGVFCVTTVKAVRRQ